MITIYIILIVVIIYYIIEVVLGSCADVYNCEIGYASCCEETRKLSSKLFFCELIPIFIIAIGFPFLLQYIL